MARYRCRWAAGTGIVGESVEGDGGGGRRVLFRAVGEEGADEREKGEREVVWSGLLVWFGLLVALLPARAAYILLFGHPFFWSSWRAGWGKACSSCHF